MIATMDAGMTDAGLVDAGLVVERFWGRIDGRDWDGVRALLAPQVVVEWPVSGERIVGAENVVAVNREYPEGWAIHLLRTVAQGTSVVSEVEVPQEGVGVFRAVSFWEVADGVIRAGREYWTGLGADERPEWRAAYTDLVNPSR